MENPCKYLLSEAVKGMPFHDLNGWAKWGFAQYSFYLYFHKLGINPEFYPRLFESLRRKPLSRQAYEVSEAHLALYERICNISRADFTDDFEIFNWFVPIDRKGHQYGDYSFKMTEEMARASRPALPPNGTPNRNSALPSCISMERRSICGGRICMGPSSTAIGPNTSRTQNSARL